MGRIGTVDYSKGLIYKICCKDPNITDIYIGSTTNMKNRKYQHKTVCNNPNANNYNLKVYEFIRNNGGWDNWDMILVEYVNCNSKQELEKEERIVIELLKSTLNMNLPTRTIKEYRKDNKKKISEQQKKNHKIYYDSHKEELLEYKKEYYEKNKEKMQQYVKEKRMFYYSQNKEKEAIKNKIQYEKNKKKLHSIVKCPFCDSLITYQGIRSHQKTLKCKKFQFIED